MSPSSHRTAFETARTGAGMRYRFIDVWHTFVMRVAENPAVAEEIIRQLAEHISQPMLARECAYQGSGAPGSLGLSPGPKLRPRQIPKEPLQDPSHHSMRITARPPRTESPRGG